MSFLSSSKIKKKNVIDPSTIAHEKCWNAWENLGAFVNGSENRKNFAQDWIGEPAPSVINTGDFNNKICFSKRMDVNNHGRNRWSDDLWWVINHPSLPFNTTISLFFFLESFLWWLWKEKKRSRANCHLGGRLRDKRARFASFKCPNRIRSWSMDKLGGIRCKCGDSDRL